MEEELKVNNLQLTPKEQENLRKTIIRIAKKYLRPDGKVRVKKVAELCGCSESHVKSTWKKYQKNGVKGIKAVKMGRPKNTGCRLTQEQEKEIKKMITDKNPSQLQFKEFLWTRSLVSELIRRQYGIKMPLSTMGYYLAKWGFTAQRPKKKHYKQNDQAVQKWLTETYPKVVKEAKKENAQINWIDETGIQNQCNYVKGYSPKGVTPVVPVASAHIRINMISAVTNQGKLRFHFYHTKMTQQLYIDFLEKLIKSTEKKVYAVMDNLSVHHGSVLKEWAEKNADKIKLFYLPSYSPELNPDEYLNNNLKHELEKSGYAKNTEELQTKAMLIMRSIQNTKGRVESFFEHKDVRYAK